MAVAAEFRSQRSKWLFLLLAVVAVWCATAVETRRAVRRTSNVCQEAPQWTATVLDKMGNEQQRDPMMDNRGKVVLVVLTDVSSSHSLDQILKLESLLSYFHGISMSDVTFVLVNSGESQDHVQQLLEKNLTLTIVQDNENSAVWSVLGGKKDDVYVYDRCGRLTYAIPFPLSIIHPKQQVVESSVISTYLDDLCGSRKCSGDQNNATLDDSADTELINTTHSTLADVTEIVNNEEQVTSEETNEDNWPSISTTNTPQVTPTATTEPPLSLWNLFQNMKKYMPWSSTQDKKESRKLNDVMKFLDEERKTEDPGTATNTSIGNEEYLCNITQRVTCNAWSKKKLDHARICCNLHACNASAQYIQKHCKQYPEHRCKKVELVLRCCQRNGSDEEANTRASPSSHPKS